MDALRGRSPSPRAAAFIPAAVFLAVRALGVAVLGLMAAGRGTPLATELRSWDGVWMLSIARYGYDGVPVTLVDAFGRHTADTSYAFFPGYPAAIAAVGVLTGGNLVVAALLVTTLAGVVAAYGLVRLAELMPGGSRRAGLLLVALFAAAPMGVVLSMAYTEALFCALAVWALVGVLRRQWLLAGLCSAAAGLVRPTGSALALAVGLAAFAAVVARRDGVRPWFAGLLAASGLLGYLGYVGWRTGTPTGWFDIQRTGWGSQFDGGASLVRFVARTAEERARGVRPRGAAHAGRLDRAARRRRPDAPAVAGAGVRGRRADHGVVQRRADPLAGAPAHAGVPAAAPGRPRPRPAPDGHGGRRGGRGGAGVGVVRGLHPHDLALRDLSRDGPDLRTRALGITVREGGAPLAAGHAVTVVGVDFGQGGRVGRYVRMVALPGKGSVLAGKLLTVAEGMRGAPGCELYVVNLSADEPDIVWVTEVWSDEAASDRALSGDLGEAGIGDVIALLAGPPELVDLTPLGGPGLPS